VGIKPVETPQAPFGLIERIGSPEGSASLSGPERR
jgi:hypothetical protein